jgi:hypothetical protein
MMPGERAALEGLLVTLRPALAVEIGMAEGGSLARIAAHSQEVHTIDLVEPDSPLPPHVHHHRGDSRQVLPALLDEFGEAGRNVDFVLVDGDHSTDVIRVDVENLLRSPAVRRTLIVLHDTMNEAARAGIEAARPEDFEKVRFVDLDFLTGVMVRKPPFEGELWGGFGVIVVDAGGDAADPDSEVARTYRAHGAHKHDAYAMIDLVAGRRREQAGERAAPDPAHVETQQARESLALQSEDGGGRMTRGALAPLSGIAFIVVAIVGFAIGGEPPSAGSSTPEEIVSHYVDNDTEVFTGGALTGLAAALLVFFGATLSGAFRHGSASKILPSVVLAGATMMAIGLAIDGMISIALADKADEIEPTSVETLQALWDNDFLPIAVGNLLLLGGSGLAILRSGALPRWLGWAALVLAVVALTPVFWIGLIGAAIWIAIISVMLTRQARAATPAQPSPAA